MVRTARSSVSRRQRNLLPVLVGPAAELRQPVRQPQRRVPERAGQRGLQIGGRIGAELHQQLGHLPPGQPGIEEREQEGDRRQAERGERDQPDRLERRPLAHAGQIEQRQHDQGQPEGIDQQRSRPTARPAGGSDGAGTAGSCPVRRSAATRLSWMCSTAAPVSTCVVMANRFAGSTPRMILNACRTSASGIAGDDHRLLGSAGEPPGREGQEDVQEHRRRQHVQQMPDAEQHRLLDPLQRRRRHREPGAHHQRSEAAHRTSPPGQDSAQHVRHDDPADQERPQGRVVPDCRWPTRGPSCR